MNEESTLKRRLMEQEADERYYKTDMNQKTIPVAAYENNIMEATDIL